MLLYNYDFTEINDMEIKYLKHYILKTYSLKVALTCIKLKQECQYAQIDTSITALFYLYLFTGNCPTRKDHTVHNVIAWKSWQIQEPLFVYFNPFVL